MPEPKAGTDAAIIMEFKIHHPNKENNLEDTVKAALLQIDEKSMQLHLKQKALLLSALGSMDLHLGGRMC